ncbi:MAG: CdaR family protein [Chloroflexota bacterium]
MVSFLRSNLVWMLLSLLISTGLWVFVTFKEDPEVTHVLSNIPISVQQPPPTMVVQPETQVVQVQVSAPSAVWAQLKADNFRAVVDASKVTQGGSQEVPVHISSTDPRVRVDSVDPSTIFLKVDPLRSKSVPVVVVPSGTVPIGYQESGPAKVTPAVVTISGPQTLVDQVSSVTINVSLDGVTKSIDQAYKPAPLGLAESDAARVALNPAQVQVDVPVTQKLMYKTLPIQPVTSGNVALGYQEVGITIDPTTVTLVGDPQTLTQMTTVPTKPIDISGVDGDRAYDATLDLPGTVALDRSQSIVVRVLVSTLSGSKTMLISPQIVNLAPNLNYQINPGAVNVTLTGPIPVLNRIQPGDVTATVDATGMTSGTQTVNVQVKSPDLLKLVSVQPQKVTLTVK